MEKNNKSRSLSRLGFIKTTALAAGAFAVVSSGFNSKDGSSNELGGRSKKPPNSKFGGVQIGTITYSWRDLPCSAADIIKYCQDSGVSSVELMGDVVESYAGLPPSPDDLPNPLSPEAQARLDGITKQYKMTLETWDVCYFP